MPPALVAGGFLLAWPEQGSLCALEEAARRP